MSGEDLHDCELSRGVEAILMAASEPISANVLADIFHVSHDDICAVIDALADFYDRSGRGFFLRQIAGGWQYATRADYESFIRDWVVDQQKNRLSQAAMETLAVIAYRQPTSRSQVSAVRGVNVDGVVRTLIARGLVEQKGRDDAGAELLVTTDLFLEVLGLASIDDLPDLAPHLPIARQLEQELIAQAHDSQLDGEM